MEFLFEYEKRKVRNPNKYFRVDEETAVIQITNNQGQTFNCLIDLEDVERVNICNWKVVKDGHTHYVRNSRYGNIHRFIKDIPADKQTDHLNCDGLDNRKSNLRAVTALENSRNRRNVKGISFEAGGYERYRVNWTDDEGKRHIESYSTSKYKTREKAKEAAERRVLEIRTSIYKSPYLNQIMFKKIQELSELI